MDIVEDIKGYVIDQINIYKEKSDDNYDFWNQHIKFVYYEAIDLAEEYKADLEIVKLGALLHDIALICEVGSRKNHHINGAKLADEILTKYSYPEEKKKRVLGCVINHRSSKNATNIEETCVADADIIAHFDNLPMVLKYAFEIEKVDLNTINDWIKNSFEDEYNDLSPKTKEKFKDRYDTICSVLIDDKKN